MAGEKMNSGRFRFGLFEFDAAARELRRENVLVHLQAQPAQVLSCLIAQAGKVVSREELRKAVWGGETFVDFERGLNFCIAQVRSALDDDAVKPRYVRTVPRRGYQFIAPVERIGQNSERTETAVAKPRISAAAAVAWICASVVLLLLALGAGYWLRSWQSSKRHPVIAVVRFDNETSDPGMTRFSDALTDSVVEQLTSTSQGRYDVIGNAHILRLARDERDLSTIGASLHAGYVVLGQVQSNGPQTRILAHLIRLPEQTHLWVARMDRPLVNPLEIEAEAAQKIAGEFSRRVVTDSSGSSLPALPAAPSR
jgi:DNA-binding winged helix-turn-helix (wHTH) protein/TolB-like protein